MMQRTLCEWMGACVLWAMVIVGAVAAERAEPDDYRMQTSTLADNVYAVITPSRALPNAENKGWNSNSAFVVTGDGVLVFDTGSSTAIGHALRQAIAKVTDQPVRWIVASHAHGDHWLGNGAFVDEGVEIIATPQAAERIRAEGDEWVKRFQRMTDGATGDSTVVPPTTVIHERTQRTLGGVDVEFIPSGGAHSPGDLMVWLPEPQVLLAGDVVYSDRMPSTFDAKVRRWIDQLGELQDVGGELAVVVPGHGDVTDMSGVRRLQSLLNDLWDAVEKGYEAGRQSYEMLPEVSSALEVYRADYPGLEEKLKRDIGHVYLQVEAASFQ